MEAVFFTRTQMIPPHTLRINNNLIPYKLQVRYLGLTLDRRLWWHPHVQTKITKAKQHLGALVSATRGNWGPRPQIAHWIYVAMVCPSVTYAALVWAHDVELKKTRALLARLDKMAAVSYTHLTLPTIYSV